MDMNGPTSPSCGGLVEQLSDLDLEFYDECEASSEYPDG